jgi:hypothetical protein
MKNKKNMKQIITLTIIGVILWTYQPIAQNKIERLT